MWLCQSVNHTASHINWHWLCKFFVSNLLYSHVMIPINRGFIVVGLFLCWPTTYRNQRPSLGLAIANVVMLKKVVVSYILDLHVVVRSNVTH